MSPHSCKTKPGAKKTFSCNAFLGICSILFKRALWCIQNDIIIFKPVAVIINDFWETAVSRLQEAWRFEDTTEGGGVYFNPVMMGNRLIGLVPSNRLVALNAATGKLLWEFVPDASVIYNWCKGITYHHGNPDRIFLISGDKLYAINAENGKVIKNFGNNGRVDFYEGLEVADSMRTRVPVSSNAPGVVYNDLFIVGCKVPDELPSTSGDIRAFNINTGKLEWVFHVIPKPGEYGRSSTWIKEEVAKNKYKTGVYEPPSMEGSIMLPTAHGGSNWGGASVNPETNMLFVNSTDIPMILKLTDLKKIRAANQLNPEILYRTYCSNCHGADKKGQTVGPDLTGRVKKYTATKIAGIIQKGAAPMPSFNFLSREQITAIVSYITDTVSQQTFETPDIPQNNEPFGFNGYSFYLDPEGDPAIAPPFGTITAIDLNTGNIKWQVPLGEDQKFKKMGIPNSGMFNRGGGIATASGLIFIGATGDNMLRAFDQQTGKVLWQFQLPGMATCIPSTYAVGNKQYVVVSVNGNQENKFKGGYIAFVIP